MTETVMTVLGPVDADQLGFTLMHEHLFINLLPEYRLDGLLNDRSLMVEEALAFKRAGGSTIVECTSGGLQRRPEQLRQVAEETGLNIVMGSGFYRDPYLNRAWFDENDVDAIADVIVTDLEVGAEGTGIRSGIIGEVGADRWYISAAEERSFRAAARAHQRTGRTITTHSARWPVGLAQLDVLESEGVDLRRVVIGHCDSVPEPSYHEAIAKRGAWVQFDTIRGNTAYDTKIRVEFILNLFEKGRGHQVLLSHDVCRRLHLKISGGFGFDYIPTKFLPELRKAGLGDREIEQLTVGNPRRALTGVLD